MLNQPFFQVTLPLMVTFIATVWAATYSQNKRFEDLKAALNRRFDELRSDMNRRFDEIVIPPRPDPGEAIGARQASRGARNREMAIAQFCTAIYSV